MNLRIPLSVFAFILIQSPNSFAAKANQFSPLHVSGGIAMPATSTSVHSNPAGIIAAPTALVLSAGAPEIWERGTYRAGLQTSGSSFGVAGGIEGNERGNNSGNNTSSSSSSFGVLAYYGLAVGTDAFTFGLAGRTGISNSSGSTFNAGMHFGVGSSAQVGITAMGLNDGVNEWGAGVALGVSQGFDFIVDAAADSDLDGLQIKPGIKVAGGPAALTLSYGTGSRRQFSEDFTAGASFQFAASTLELQYNAGGALSNYFAAFTLGI